MGCLPARSLLNLAATAFLVWARGAEHMPFKFPAKFAHLTKKAIVLPTPYTSLAVATIPLLLLLLMPCCP